LLATDVTIVTEIGRAAAARGGGWGRLLVRREPSRSPTPTRWPTASRPPCGVIAQRISQFSLTVSGIMGKLDLFLLAAVAWPCW
jgi:hypothetical protein